MNKKVYVGSLIAIIILLIIGFSINGRVIEEQRKTEGGLISFFERIFGLNKQEIQKTDEKRLIEKNQIIEQKQEFFAIEKNPGITTMRDYDIKEWNELYSIEKSEEEDTLNIDEKAKIMFTYTCESKCKEEAKLQPIIVDESGNEIRELECERTLIKEGELECMVQAESLLPLSNIAFTIIDNPETPTKKRLDSILKIKKTRTVIRIPRDDETGEILTWCKCEELTVYDMGTKKTKGGLMHEFIVEATVQGNPLECKTKQNVESTWINKEEEEIIKLHLKKNPGGSVGVSPEGEHGIGSGNPISDDYNNQEGVLHARAERGARVGISYVMALSQDGSSIVWVDNPGVDHGEALKEMKIVGLKARMDYFRALVRDSDNRLNPRCLESFYVYHDYEKGTTTMSKSKPENDYGI